MKAVLCITLCLALSVAAQICASSPFGAATGFNLFVLSSSATLDGCFGDVEGAIAGAGPINLEGYSVGLKVGTSFPYDYTLVSAGAITFKNGEVSNGGISGSDVSGVSNVDIKFTDGKTYFAECCQDADCDACVTGASFINFNDARTNLNALSDTFSTYTSTPGVNVVDRYGNIDLYCSTTAAFNVFNNLKVDSTHHQLQIHCNADQTVLINYSSDTPGLPSGLSVNLIDGITAGTVIHHFTNLYLTIYTELEGTLFAPRSALSFSGASILGDVIVDIYDTPGGCNRGQINNAPFCGCVPPTSTNNYCCSYSHDSATRTICSTLPCSYQSLPQWAFQFQDVVETCSDCCYRTNKF